MEMLFL